MADKHALHILFEKQKAWRNGKICHYPAQVRGFYKELQLLCCMAKHPPSVGKWTIFYARLLRLIGLYQHQRDEAGRFGDRFVERILSLRQTCRLQGKRTFCILVKAMEAFIQGIKPEIQWINSHSPSAP